MSDLTGLEILFVICAIVGGAFVLLRLVMQFIGIDHDMDTGADTHDVDYGDGTDPGFKIISLQTLFAFFMMFGLVGLAMSNETNVEGYLTAVIAIAAGVISAVVIAGLFKFSNKLQSTGTININKSVGDQGTVYLTIPADGIGRVQVYTGNRLMELDAKSGDSTEIKTGESIKVVGIQGNVLVVEKI